MANELEQDLPIENPQQETDVPIEAPIRVKSPVADDIRNFLTFQAAGVESSTEQKPLVDAFREISAQNGSDPAGTLRKKAAQKVEQDKQNYKDAFEADPGGSLQEVQDTYDVTQNLIKGLDEEIKDPDLAFVRSVSKGSIDPETEKRLAVELKLSKMMRGIWDNMSKTDVVTSALGLVVPGNIVKDNIDLTGSAFNAREFMQNLVTNYKRMSPEDQLKYLPAIKDVLKEDLDNNFKVLGVLNDLLTPGGEDDLQEFNSIWAGLDVIDAATLGSAIGFKVASITKKLNAVRALAKAGNVEVAGDVNAGAILSDEVSHSANLDKLAAVDNATAMDTSEFNAARTEGLSNLSMKRIDEYYDQMQSIKDQVSGENLFLKEGLLNNEERKAVEQSKIDHLRSFPGVENIRVAERTRDHTIFRFDTTLTDGNVVPTKFKLNLSLNDVGMYEQSEVGVINRFAASPSAWAKGNLREDVAAAQRGDSAQARVLNQLRDLQRTAVKDILGPLGLKGLNPVSRKRLAQIDEVLLVGDKESKIYSPLELKAGVNGIPLDDKQIEAYYKIRTLIDGTYQIRNDEKKQELLLKGYRNVNLNDETKAIAKPYFDSQSARGSLTTARANFVWDQETGRLSKVSDLDLKNEYSQGRAIVKFEGSQEVPNSSEKVYYALVNRKNITEFPEHVLNYRVGYVPKINDRAAYFVKAFKANRIDGTTYAADSPKAEVSTIRAFDNRADAETFARQQQDLHPNTIFRALEDRQIEKERRISGLGTEYGGGGLYTGARATEEIPFGLDGVPQDRLNAFESISRNIANVSRYVSRNTWRMGMEQRALNTANELIPNANFQSFADLALAPDTHQGRFIRKLHSQIEDWMGFPSKEEQLWQALTQEVYDSALGQKLPGVAKKSLLYLKHKDPIAAARSAAFNSLLGWFNPIQLWVQAQGAAVALSKNILNPKRMANVLRLQTALSSIDWLEGEKNIAHAARAFRMSAEDLTELKNAWVKSGLRDSILSTADHAASLRGRGVGLDALSRLSNKALFFYRKGELFNRRVSFITAYQDWKYANVGKKVDDAALKEILSGANNYMLNLSRSNRAQWQKGLLGLPTQFLQVSTKYLETLLGINGHFTKSDRAKLFLTQFMLYGAAGIPLGSMGSQWLAQAFGVNNQAALEKVDPEVRKAINEGFTGWATMAMFGIDIDVGDRSSLQNGLNLVVDQMLFEESTIPEMMLGAFGSTTTRFWDGLNNTFAPLSLGLAGIKEIDPYNAATLMVQPLSSWRNASKALFMHQFSKIIDRRGQTVLAKDFNPATEIAQAIGFRPSQEVQVRKLRDINKAKSDLRSDVTNSVVQIYWDYAKKVKNGFGNDQLREDTQNKIALMMQTLDTPFEQKQVREAVKNRLTQGEDQFSKEWRKIRQSFNDGSIDLLENMHTTLTNSGLLQQRTVEPEPEVEQEAPSVFEPTRGVKNNNPGNIEKNPNNDWRGKIKGNDPRFETFRTPEEGISAIPKTLRTYITKRKLTSVDTMIRRWSATDQDSYVRYVENAMHKAGLPTEITDGVDRDKFLRVMTKAIVQFENAGYEYPSNVMDKAFSIAGI